MTTDPTDASLWRDLYRTLRAVENDIAGLYVERGLGSFRSRYVKPLIRLHHRGPLTIRALAAELGVTHSATSQTVRELVKLGLVAVSPGATDARTRVVELSASGRSEIPFMEAEWRATEATLAELEAETSFPMHRLAAELSAALDASSFRERLLRNLDGEPPRG